MKRLLVAASTAVTLLLAGCASTIQSNVTTFHEWPAELANKTYVFEAPPPQDDTLELRSYQNLVRSELARLGFQDAGAQGNPGLKVSMRFTTTDVPVRLLVPVEPFFASPFYRPRFMFGNPYFRTRWAGRHAWGGAFYSPFYDPFWGGPEAYTEVTRHVFQREVAVAIKSATDGRRLFDVTVHNESREMSTPAVMPALVQSAFTGFPGVSGVARRVELKREG